MRGIGVAALCLLVFGLGGCQTDKPLLDASWSSFSFKASNPDPNAEPKLEDDFLLNNEPRRIAEVYFERGYYGNAERSYRDAVEKNPGDIDSWIGLGRATTISTGSTLPTVHTGMLRGTVASASNCSITRATPSCFAVIL